MWFNELYRKIIKYEIKITCNTEHWTVIKESNPTVKIGFSNYSNIDNIQKNS